VSGFGSQPFGSSPYGIGTPAVATPAGGSVLRNAQTGASEGSRFLNPATRDYAIDANGRTLGLGNVRALVEIALSTTSGTSAMQALGHTLRSIARIDNNFEYRVRDTIAASVAHLTDRSIIQLTATTIEDRGRGRRLIRVFWRDLTTGQEDFSELR
jgi:hypothetical protein